MSAVTAVKPGEVSLLRQEAAIVHEILKLNVKGLTPEESLVEPMPGVNCVNWVVGHTLEVYQSELSMLGQEPVVAPGTLARYARGTPPLSDPGEAIALPQLMAWWEATTPRIDAGRARLTAEALDRPAPFSPGNDPKETVRSLLGAIVFHQAYHAGQVGLLRRFAGKKGAIP
jgi:uncharacterized damage-inducible protein DinB